MTPTENSGNNSFLSDPQERNCKGMKLTKQFLCPMELLKFPSCFISSWLSTNSHHTLFSITFEKECLWFLSCHLLPSSRRCEAAWSPHGICGPRKEEAVVLEGNWLDVSFSYNQQPAATWLWTLQGSGRTRSPREQLKGRKTAGTSWLAAITCTDGSNSCERKPCSRNSPTHLLTMEEASV